MTAGITSAVTVPPLDAMRAAPRGPFPDFGFLSRRVLLEVFGVIGQLCDVVGFDVMQGIGKRHLATLMMMSVCFTIGCDVDDLRPRPAVGKRRCQTARQILASFEQAFERNRLRNRPVVKEHRDAFARGGTDSVRCRRGHASATGIAPGAAPHLPGPFGLVW